MDKVSKSVTHQPQAESLLLNLVDHITNSPFGALNMQTSIFSCRSLPPNFDKFILILSGKARIIINFTKEVTSREFFEMHLPGVSGI